MFKKFLLCLLGIILCSLSAYGQLDSLVYDLRPIGIVTEEKGELRANIEGMPFLLNNEYKSELVKGYTLPGVWLAPSLSYQPLENLRLELGVHMLHFWGANKYPNFNYSRLAGWNGKNTQTGFHCVPTFRAHLQLTPRFHIVLGTIYGKNRHGLIRPLYNDELNLSGDPENGVQILLDTSPVRLDAWVNWESFIFKNDQGQESFCFGLSTRFQPSRKIARTQWYIPLQAIFQHRGGEINTTATDRSIKTWLNAAAGVGVTIPFHTKVNTMLNFEADAAYFGQQAGSLLPFKSGYGFYGKAELRVWRCKAEIGYWACNDFVSIYGNPLYGSVSNDREGFLLSRPRMLTARLEYAQEIGKGFSWGIHADLMEQFACKGYNVGSPDPLPQKATFNNSVGIYLRAHPSFLIKRFGKK